MNSWYNAPHTAQIPGDEKLENPRSCALGVVNEMAALHKGQTIVLVSHTVVNRIISFC